MSDNEFEKLLRILAKAHDCDVKTCRRQVMAAANNGHERPITYLRRLYAGLRDLKPRSRINSMARKGNTIVTEDRDESIRTAKAMRRAVRRRETYSEAYAAICEDEAEHDRADLRRKFGK